MEDEEVFPVLVVFEVWSPPPPADLRIIVTGSIPQLGSWFTEKPVSMTLQGEGVWKLQLTLSSTDQFEYKYACYSNKEGRCVGYEQGPNRQMLIPLKLRQDTVHHDDGTGLRKIGVKDVWSTVPPQQATQPIAPQRPGGTPQYRPQMPPQMYGQPQMYGYPQPYYPQPMPYAMQQRAMPMGYQQPVMSVSGAQVAAENATNYIQQQMMRQSAGQLPGIPNQQTPPQQPQQPQQQPDNQLNARLTKVVGEVSGLKKKLKESQREQRDLARANKEMEDKYESQIRDLTQKVKHLEEDLESTRRAKDEIQAKALEQGKSAAAAEAAESLSRQLRQVQDRAAETEKTLRAESESLKAQIEAARKQAHDAQDHAAKLETDLHDARLVASEIDSIQATLAQFAGSIKHSDTRMLVMHSESPIHDRVATILQYYEAESRRTDPSKYKRLLTACKDLRSEFERQKKKIREIVRTHVEGSGDVVHKALKDFLADQQKEKEVYVERYYKQYNERKRLANEIVDLKGKIRVFGRARPFNTRERENGHANVLAFPEANRLLIGMDAEKFMLVNDVAQGTDTEVGKNKIEDVKTYELDHIFPPNTTQDQVFEEVRHLIASVTDGYNVTVFAYGQTGSGKTHTMDGTREQPGITYRSLGLFFDAGELQRSNSMKMLKRSKSVLKPRIEVEISMLEIYNEDIRDLLDDSDIVKRAKLEVRQSADGGSYVPNLTRLPAKSLQEALDIMDQGRENRKTSATKMNAQSSRSHMVFTAYVSVTNPVTKDKTTSKLHLVDLAGSERVSKTGASGDQLKEAMAINKSLSALGDVISSLTSNSDKTHVPYRNSKLTFLLQDSLCGNSRTAMFVNLSPSSDNYWETISTLNFGARAASVELGQVQKNFESGEIAQLRDQLSKLQNQLASTKGAIGGTTEELAAARSRVTELERENDAKERRIKGLQSKTDEQAKQLEQQDATLDKKLEKMRADLKAKDEAIKALEEQVKKAKKDVNGAQKGQSSELEAVQRELTSTKKQMAEIQKSTKALETKLQAAEAKAKKAEQRAAKAEEDAAQARESLKSSRTTEMAKPQGTDTGGNSRGSTNTNLRATRNLKINPAGASRARSPRAASPRATSPQSSPRDGFLTKGRSTSKSTRTAARANSSTSPQRSDGGSGNRRAPPRAGGEGQTVSNTADQADDDSYSLEDQKSQAIDRTTTNGDYDGSATGSVLDDNNDNNDNNDDNDDNNYNDDDNNDDNNDNNDNNNDDNVDKSGGDDDLFG